MMASGAELIIESLVLSEYLNRYWRIEKNAWLRSNPKLAIQFQDDKAFRTSPHFKPIGAAAVAEAGQILSLCGMRDTPLQIADISGIFVEFEAGNLDFNDGVLLETCRLRGWKMLTHDSDMTVGGIDVITTNLRLIAACP
jgi:predicted nucleic acid-binding protein